MKKLPAVLLSSIVTFSTFGVATNTHADKLDDVIASGKLRCGVMLDFPPAGFRDENNNPVGFDVDYCKDMAEALEVDAEIVETPAPDRIPALISNRIDISIAGSSITLQRAKTVGFSIPYASYNFVVVTKKDSGIKSFEDLNGHHIGGVRGTAPESMFRQYRDQNWGEDSSKYTAFTSDTDQNLALAQGKIDAFITVVTSAAQLKKLPQFSDFSICCAAPFQDDIVGMMTRRQDEGFLRWVNIFIYHQVREGRYKGLYAKWYGSEAPSLINSQVYY